MFINRKKEIEILKQLVLALKGEKGINCAILGLRRIGKTELILEFKRRHKDTEVVIPYFNIQSSISSPQRFSLDYMSILLETVCLCKKIKFPQKTITREDIPVLAALLGKEIYENIRTILHALEKEEYTEALRSLFNLPEFISETLGMKILYIIDEFQELDDFKFYHIDIFSLMRTVTEKQKHTKYILTGSIISFMEDIFTNSRNPLFNQFKMLHLDYFNAHDTRTQAAYIWDYHFIKVDTDVFSHLYTLTKGHPFYSSSIAERAFFESRYNNNIIDTKLIDYAFLKEVLDKEGKLNILFEYIYNYSLEKVQRKGSLKTPLLFLAEDEGISLSELSKKLNRPTGQIANIVKSLLKTDLIIKKDMKYYFRDPVFRFWLAKTALGKELSIAFNKNVTTTFIEELKEKFLEKSTELGRMKEFELYYFVTEHQGKELSGIVLPHFKKIIKNYILPNGNEIDLFALNDESWAFEIKWKNKRIGKKEIEAFIKKIKADHYVYISKDGFTDKALHYYDRKKIILLDENDLRKA